MSDDKDRGPLRRYEVTWTNGHVEIVEAHQCLAPHRSLFDDEPKSRWMWHGEVDGRWGLVLAVPDDDIAIVRDVTTDEQVSS